MCGILFSLSFSSQATTQTNDHQEPKTLLVPDWMNRVSQESSKRGPDDTGTKTISIPFPSQFQNEKEEKETKKNGDWVAQLTSWVLHLRGPRLEPQPIQDLKGNILAFNGEIYEYGGITDEIMGGFDLDKDNDTLILSRLLSLYSSSQCAEGNIVKVLGNVRGEWALIYYVAASNTIYFGRDFLGRRSLLYYSKNGDDQSDDPLFVLASVTDGGNGKESNQKWTELSCKGLYKLDLNVIMEKKVKNIAEYLVEIPWGSLKPPQMNMHKVDPETDLTNIDQIDLSNLPLQLTIQQKQARDTLLNTLSLSVWRRVNSIPNHIIPNPKQDSLENLNPAKLAILFSGGLDCMVLAALASKHVHQGEPIDLLNVSFENPRSLEAKEKKNQKQSESERLDHTHPLTFSTPDRKTGIKGWNELCTKFPTRTWRFVQVNVEYEEAMKWKEYIVTLMYPLATVMDLSIAMAFWFASRGQGYLLDNNVADGSEGTSKNNNFNVVTATNNDDHVLTANVKERRDVDQRNEEHDQKKKYSDQRNKWVGVPYTSTARVLLSGLGADEQLGGYSRHRKSFEKGGWDELASEIALDVGRISLRNLGRDDRIISSHGKEVRFPFLDENVYDYLSSLPVHIKTDPRFDRAVGDKMLLRLVARELGFDRAAVEAKRAVQFGARTAKMEFSKQKGHELL